jgi:hypothetical protein
VGLRDAWVSVMRTLGPRSPRRLTARQAEQLLTGQPVGPDLRRMSRLLAAAAAPPRPGELAGERAAVEGFRRDYRRPVGSRRRRLAVALRRTVVVKAATGAVVLFVGGTALAASTGSLPDPAQQSAHDLLGVPAPRHHDPGLGDDTRHGSDPAEVPSGTPAAGPTSPSPTPSPTTGVAQLCRTYFAALAQHREPDPAVRQQLVVVAGKPSKVVTYCTHLLGVPAPDGVSTTGGTPGGDKPTDKPKRKKDPPKRP